MSVRLAYLTRSMSRSVDRIFRDKTVFSLPPAWAPTSVFQTKRNGRLQPTSVGTRLPTTHNLANHRWQLHTTRPVTGESVNVRRHDNEPQATSASNERASAGSFRCGRALQSALTLSVYVFGASESVLRTNQLKRQRSGPCAEPQRVPFLARPWGGTESISALWAVAVPRIDTFCRAGPGGGNVTAKSACRAGVESAPAFATPSPNANTTDGRSRARWGFTHMSRQAKLFFAATHRDKQHGKPAEHKDRDSASPPSVEWRRAAGSNAGPVDARPLPLGTGADSSRGGVAIVRSAH